MVSRDLLQTSDGKMEEEFTDDPLLDALNYGETFSTLDDIEERYDPCETCARKVDLVPQVDPFSDPMNHREIILERQILLIENLMNLMGLYKDRFSRDKTDSFDISDMTPHGHANLLIERNFNNLTSMWKFLGPDFDPFPNRKEKQVDRNRPDVEILMPEGTLHGMNKDETLVVFSKIERIILNGIKERKDLFEMISKGKNPRFEEPSRYSRIDTMTPVEILSVTASSNSIARGESSDPGSKDVSWSSEVGSIRSRDAHWLDRTNASILRLKEKLTVPFLRKCIDHLIHVNDRFIRENAPEDGKSTKRSVRETNQKGDDGKTIKRRKK
jgi:hypothetical protein